MFLFPLPIPKLLNTKIKVIKLIKYYKHLESVEKVFVHFILVTYVIHFFTGMLQLPQALNIIIDLYLLYFWWLVFNLKKWKKINLGIVFILIYGVIGLLLNHFSLFVYINGLRKTVLYFSIVLYLFYFVKTERITIFSTFLIQLYIWIGISQLVFNIYIDLFLEKAPLKHTSLFVVNDLYTGSFGYGTTGVLGVFQVMIIILVIYRFINKNISIKTAFIYVVLIIISILNSEVKIFFYLIPISGFLILYYFRIRISYKYTAALILTLSFLLLSTFYSFLGIETNVYKTVFEFAENIGDPTSSSISGIALRGSIILNAIDGIKETGNWVFGVGMGNMRESVLSIGNGEYFEKYFHFSGTGISLGIALIIWEFGLLGLILWLFYPLFLFKKMDKNNQSTSLAKIFLILLLISNFYTLGNFSIHLITITYTFLGLNLARK